jgi:hypothetical protein
MDNLIWMIVIGSVVLAGFKVYDIRKGASAGGVKEKGEEREEFYYKMKPYFFTRSEQAFYAELRKQAGERYAIFSKVRIPDFIEVDVNKYKDRSRWQTFWNKIKSKHVDFLLCDPVTLRPQIAIEVNGKSHDTEKMITTDSFVGKVYESAGIKFLTFHVGENYSDKIRELI